MLSRIDLNLFRVFEAVMQHRSVRGASNDLRVTPSAVSHALARLRQALGDELFVLGETGMEPTPRALQLAPDIRNGLASFQSAVTAQSFVPSQAMRAFRLVGSDFVAAMILPPLVARLATTAPQIDLRVFPANRTDVIRNLDDGRVDVLIGWFDELPERLCRTPLFQEQEAMVVRSGHPLTQQPVTRERLCAFPHVVVELTGSEGRADDGFHDERDGLRRIWLERFLLEMSDDDSGTIARVAVSVPYSATVPLVLQASDMVATLPRRLARRYSADASLAMLDLPFPPLTLDIEAVWHRRADRDPGMRWFLQELQEVAAEFSKDGDEA